MQFVLERCTIRPWRLNDAESLARHANNRKISLAVRDLFPHPYTIQDAHEFLQQATSEKSELKFCVEIEGAAVGGLVFTQVSRSVVIERPLDIGWANSSGAA